MKWVSKILASDLNHNRLGERLAEQRALHRQLKQLLPEPVDSQLKAAVLQHGCLSLFVPSPVWASRFRYLLPQLQKQLRDRGIEVERIRTRILPSDSAKPDRGRTRGGLRLSREAGERLKQAAQAIDDPSLREALLRISRHNENR